MFKTILLIENDEVLKEFFTRVFYIDGFEVVYLDEPAHLDQLNKKTLIELDMVVIDDCDEPAAFTEKLKDLLSEHNRIKPLPILGVLKKGIDPEPAHKNFDAVVVKDNFNIQLLTDLVERLTS